MKKISGLMMFSIFGVLLALCSLVSAIIYDAHLRENYSTIEAEITKVEDGKVSAVGDFNGTRYSYQFPSTEYEVGDTIDLYIDQSKQDVTNDISNCYVSLSSILLLVTVTMAIINITLERKYFDVDNNEDTTVLEE